MNTQANDGNASSQLRFKLRTLLTAFAVLSIPLTLLHWLGQFFVLPIIFSACLACICYWNYHVEAPKKLLIISIIAIPISIMFSIFYLMVSFRVGGTGTLLLHTVINAAACVSLVLLKCPRKVVVLILIVAAVFPYYLRIEQIQEVRRRFDQLLADHPLESLESRLDFETPQSDEPITLTNLSPTVLSNMTEQEKRRDYQRQWALQQLHEHFSSQFAAATGFGYMRMRRIWPEDLEPAPVEIVELPLPISKSLFGKVDSAGADSLHRRVALDFLSLEKMGYVRDKQHVAGFQSHSPTNLVEAIDSTRSCGEQAEATADEDSDWQLTRLELVSLLRHSPPRVYLADSLPAMDELHKFEHRALSEFEQECLPQLRAERDVVVSAKGTNVRMVGALRASQDCLDCHQGSKGKLLGAFSYEFARVEKKVEEPDDELVAERLVNDQQLAANAMP